jgi:hypothetical protein
MLFAEVAKWTMGAAACAAIQAGALAEFGPLPNAASEAGGGCELNKPLRFSFGQCRPRHPSGAKRRPKELQNGLALGESPLPDPVFGVQTPGGGGRTGPWPGSSRSGATTQGLASQGLPLGAAIQRPGSGRAQHRDDRAGAELQSRPVKATSWGSQSCDPVIGGPARWAASWGVVIPRPGQGRAQSRPGVTKTKSAGSQ